MSIKIIRSGDFKTIPWSGGTTTELFIYPPESEYPKRNFAFRLSRATIELERSDFTPLLGVRRKLMVLEGELEIIHKNHHSKKLLPLQFDVFSGDWETHSIGKAIDLNLMFRGSTDGGFEVIDCSKNQAFPFVLNHDFTLLYVFQGSLTFEEIVLINGDVLVLESEEMKSLLLEVEKGSIIVATKVNL